MPAGNPTQMLIILDWLVGTYYFDGALFEDTATLNPYFDGSIAPAIWEGTANNSVSLLSANFNISTAKTLIEFALSLTETLSKLCAKAINDICIPSDSGFAMQFDGANQYLSLGTMGSFGSNLGSGLYAKFSFASTTATSGAILFGTAWSTSCIITFNVNNGGVSKRLYFFSQDNGSKQLKGTIDPTMNILDGNPHVFELTVTFSTNTILLKIDGITQTTNYVSQQTPATFANFGSTRPFIIGAYQNYSTVQNYCAYTIDNFLIGTSPSNLYGSYSFDDRTATDLSGNGNNGILSTTLTNGALPAFVTGLTAVNLLQRFTSKFPTDSISLSEVLAYLSILYRSLTDSIIPVESFGKSNGKNNSQIRFILNRKLNKRYCKGIQRKHQPSRNFAQGY